MNFTFQGSNPGGTGMSTLPKQLIIRAMQLSFLLLFAVCFQVGATPTYGQATVSFTGKDVPLKTVFASVKKQTGYGVFFENGEAMLQSSAPVTLDLKNVALETFLRICLKDQPLEYVLEGKTIFIKKKEAPIVTLASPPPTPGDPILQIKGRVTNDKGEPLVNANITVKRTGHGTVTDANGNFTLRNVNSDDVVSVTFIGYKTVSMSIKDHISLTVMMSAATNDLDKVVVQAYGTTSQRLATGNIGTVRAEDIDKHPVMNALQAVQGQIPGVVVTNTSGYASGSIKVEIRGRNTINPNFPSDPLYIIDGVPITILNLYGNDSYDKGSQGVIQSGLSSPANGQSPLFNLNPSDIESIEVLKDADATAIYGSRASNGVILITTKKGKPGKTNFNLNVYTGMSKTSRYYHLLNTAQYVSMREEALANDGLPIDINNAYDLVAWDTTRYTDWQKFLWGGMGKTLDCEASVSGGNDQTTFRLAGAYHYLTEILTSNGANKRGSFSLNINHNSKNRKFSTSFSGSYSTASSNMIYVPGSINLPPNAPAIFDKLGNLNYAEWDPAIGYSPFEALLEPYNTNTSLLNSSLLLSYQVISGLLFKTNFGYNNILTQQSYLIPIKSQDPANNPTGMATFGYTLTHNTIIEPQLDYSKYISKGKLNILIGATTQNNSTSSNRITGFNYTNDALLSSVSNAPNQSANNSLGFYKYSALFGRINYTWENKYIINLNTRRDGTSRFGPGRQYGTFGSAGAAWIFTEENWFKSNLSFISFGKLRASYGIIGGDQIGDYSYLSQWAYNGFLYNSSQALNPLGHSDSTLHWQVNHKLETAIDINFLKDRLTVQVAWYRDRCNDQLVYYPTPTFTGFGGVNSNSPANVENSGFEFNLSSKNIDNKNFKWLTKFNIGINRNKLISYPNLSQSPYATKFVVGKPLTIQRKLHFTGVDTQTGLYTFEDKNKDGQITIDYSNKTSDDTYTIDLAPRFDGGFTNNISYKNWDLSIFFYFKKQKGRNAISSLDIPGDISNQPTSVLNRWQKPGDKATYARFTTSPSDQSYFNYLLYSDAVFTDASFIRLQNLSISYRLSERNTKKIGIENLRIYLQGENLFTFTKYNGLDPELQNFGSLPKARILTTGISCNF